MVINYDPAVIIKSGIEKQSGKADVGVDGRDALLVGKKPEGVSRRLQEAKKKTGTGGSLAGAKSRAGAVVGACLGH
jgi:hypothetical protein